VTVFPGNPPIEFGNTASGVVSISTADQITSQTRPSILISPASFSGQLPFQVGGKSSGQVYANYQPSSLLKAINPAALEDIKKFESLDAGLQHILKVNRFTTIKSFLYGLDENYAIQVYHPSGDQVLTQKRTLVYGLTTMETVMGPHRFHSGIGLAKNSAAYVLGNLDITDKSFDYYLTSSYQYTHKNYSLKTGFLNDRRDFSFSGQVPTYSFAMAPDHPSISSQSSVEVDANEWFTYAKITSVPDWVFGVGFRKLLNQPDIDFEKRFSYQANATKYLKNGHQLIAGAGSFNQMTLDESTYTAELITNRQAGFDLLLAHKWPVMLSAYYKNRLSKQETSEWYGLEGQIQPKISNWLDANLSYALVAPIDEGEYTQFFRYQVQLKPNAFWQIGVFGLLRSGLSTKIYQDARFRNGLQVFEPLVESNQQIQMPGYNSLNLNVSRMLVVRDSWLAILFANVNNLTNRDNPRSIRYSEDYSDFSYNLLGKRAIYFGVSVQF
jgi:hypothetical protein